MKLMQASDHQVSDQMTVDRRSLFSTVIKATSGVAITLAATFGVSIAHAQSAGRSSAVLAHQSLDKGETIVLSDADQKKADVEFNQRRLLRFHQLWNLYLFRNEQEERDLKAEFEASFQLDSEAPMAAELEAAERENREPQVINIPLSKETSQLKAAAAKKEDFNTTARKESDSTRLGMMHAGMPVDAISEAIRHNSKVLEKRLREEIRRGGERADKAQANLDYLRKTLLPKIDDRQYFGVSPKAFSQEFNKVVGHGTTR